MTLWQRLSLLWRKFSPLEERLFAEVREILPNKAREVFDAQVTSINLVRRLPRWTEICYWQRRRTKVNWGDVPAFPRVDEFPLAEVRFKARGLRFKATLNAIKGHIFDFTIIPSPEGVAFTPWDTEPTIKLLNNPLEPVPAIPRIETLPEQWIAFLGRYPTGQVADWQLHNASSAYRVPLEDGEYLVLAEHEGNEFILFRLEPPSEVLFYLPSHDGKAELLDRSLDSVILGSG